ncbi:MAG: Archaeal/vacuolar-type H+-ATPase subunit I [Candidatus Methanohalarchaeum thermophilum]|uniref:Archaeal/vacuolar-type H+-ATPase subunit I n=1 Tax=Methanohalarchaeum thermophilum TaxID=1903181 RepID=A0A1Q6DXB7_METT1|nr:MAG: Archaeal/vacuolar-type H+-ATPase subunit I [Candidatus Methanohalarchaeum thermophilum]
MDESTYSEVVETVDKLEKKIAVLKERVETKESEIRRLEEKNGELRKKLKESQKNKPSGLETQERSGDEEILDEKFEKDKGKAKCEESQNQGNEILDKNKEDHESSREKTDDRKDESVMIASSAGERDKSSSGELIVADENLNNSEDDNEECDDIIVVEGDEE